MPIHSSRSRDRRSPSSAKGTARCWSGARLYRTGGLLLSAAIVFAQAGQTHAQTNTPIYVDDSPSAETAISRALELAAVGNVTEAIDVLQRTLLEYSGSVTMSQSDPDVFISVRSRIHDILLSDRAKLDRYRTRQQATAEGLLRAGELERIEQSYLLTSAGCDAALRLAQRQIEDARFQAAAHTLLQLDRHPDRSGERARQALTLLSLAARYIPDIDANRPLVEAIGSVAVRWAGARGVEAPDLSPLPLPKSSLVRHAFDPSPQISLEGMLSRPLATDSIGQPIDLLENVISRNASRRLPATALVLHALPTVYQDQVIVNDSQTISSWNRFTLKLNWRLRVDAPIVSEAMGTAFGVDDLSSVQVVDDVVIAVTGLSMSGRSAPERYVIAIDARTGRQIWGTSLAELGVSELSRAIIRGRPSIDQGVVVLSVVRHSREQRVITTGLIGLDMRTGELLWNRPSASIGVQPYGWNVPAVDAAASGSGLTFRTDTVGVTSAIESATGRTRWIRRFDTDGMYGGRAAQPWMNNQPLLHEGLLFTMNPAANAIVGLDPLTGAERLRVPASRFGSPSYLLVAGEHLLGVSETEVVAAKFDRQTIRALTDPAADPQGARLTTNRVYSSTGRGIRGRVMTTPGQLIVPTDSGISVVDIEETVRRGIGAVEPKQIRLEQPGQIAAIDGQLVVVDDQFVHSYSLWSVAEQYLTRAMELDPNDPDPAITFAELSYQADQGNAIMPAIDHALRALASDPLSDDHDAARTRLFRVILEMISPKRGDRTAIVRLSDETRGELINRLSLTASLPTERVAYMMAAGDYFESAGNVRDAIDMYQRALESEILATATVELEGTGIPAGIEATRRMRRLVAAAGRDAYAVYDAEAERSKLQLAADAGPADFESIARRYPLAEITPELWSRAAELYLESERVPLAVFALEEAASAAEIIWPVDDPRVSAIYSRVVGLMLHHSRVNSAIDRIRRADAQGIPLSLTVDGEPMDSAGLRAYAIEMAEGRQRRPIIGPTLEDSTTLEGWVIAKLDSPGREIRTDRIVMRRTDSRIGVFAPGENGEGLVQLWGDVRDELPLRIDGDRLLVAVVVDRAENVDHLVRARNLDTGEILWESQPFRTQFGLARMTQPEISRVPSVQTPLRSRVRMNELTYSFDAGMMVLFERSGRALALDLSDGRTLWTRSELMDVVHDVDLNAGLVVVAGSNLVGEQWFDVNHRPEDRAPIVHVIEARTGRTLHSRKEPLSIRWVRVTPEAEAILGTEEGIVAIDAHRGLVRWRNETDALAMSRIGLPMLGRLLVRASDNALWMIDTSTGSVDPQPLDVRGRLERGFGRLEVTELAQNFAVATDRGVVVLDQQGETVGADTAADSMMVLPAAFGDQHFVHISRDGTPIDTKFFRFRLTVFTLPDGRAVAESGIELQGDPSSIALLDDMIIVSAYRNSVIIRAPGPEDARRAPSPLPATIQQPTAEPDTDESDLDEFEQELTPLRAVPSSR